MKEKHVKSFSELKLPPTLLQALQKMNFETPTPIQAQAIPVALQGRDILGSAQTGTGKTAAFSLPMIVHLFNNQKSCALVMTPTRELAAQVLKNIQGMLSMTPNIKTALLIGGDSMFKQLQQLKQRPRIIVGTPGRINDHLEQKTLNLMNTDFVVLDETDRMLDMGFGVQIDRVLKFVAPKRQTLLFSATLPPHIIKLADRYQKSPQRIAVGSIHTPIERIKQDVLQMTTAEKYGNLLAELQKREGSIILFVKTKHGADKMTKKLEKEGHTAGAIHGNLNQNQRNRAIQAFRDKKFRVMVATDVAARGLDIPHIEHVINYDLPQVAEDFIHRVGRTGRAGAEGSAVSFVTPEDREKWRDIHLLMNPGEKPARAPQQQQRAQQGGQKSGGGKSRKPGNRQRFADSREESGQHRRGGGGFGGNSPYANRSERSDDRKDQGGFGKKRRYGKRMQNRSKPRAA